MINRHYEFTGLQAFDSSVADDLYRDCTHFFGHRNEDFEIAVEEAVCNAARYSLDGVKRGIISLWLRITDTDLSLTVCSRTHFFDALSYQQELKALAADPRYANMDWGDYVGLSAMGCGIWYMLTAVDYLCMDHKGQYVLLSKSLCSLDRTVTTKIGALVPRFFIRTRDLVV